MTQIGILDEGRDGAPVAAPRHGFSARWLASPRALRVPLGVFAACLVVLAWVEQWRLLDQLLTRHVNADNTILWLFARDWSRLRLYEPTFYGQSYGVTLEGIPTAILHALGAPYPLALPLALFMLAWGAWLCLAIGAYRRGMPLAALAALAAPSLLQTRHWVVVGVIGTGVGRLLAAACAGLALRALDTPRRVFATVTLGGLAVAFDTASALLAAPALLWAGLRWLHKRRTWLPAALGLIAPLAWIALNAWFTHVRPDHDFHKIWSYEPELRPLLQNLRAPDQLLGPHAPELAHRGASIPIALCALLLLALGAGAWREAAAVSCVTAQLVYLAALEKSLDDQGTLWFPAARMTLTVPMATWFVAALTLRACWRRLGPRRHRWPAAGVLAAAALALLTASSVSVRALQWDERLRGIEQAGMATGFLPLARPWNVAAQCEQAQREAAAFGTSIVAFPGEHVANYACPALYPELVTVYPKYERRYWVLDELSQTSQRRMILWGRNEQLCQQRIAHRLFDECHAVADHRAVALDWHDRARDKDPLQILHALGVFVRPFGPGCKPRDRENCDWWHQRYH